jgi:hypothetical protein
MPRVALDDAESTLLADVGLDRNADVVHAAVG